MTLETLKGIETIGGFDVVDMDALKDKFPEKFTEQMIDGKPTSKMDWQWFESEIRPNKFIYVRHDVNSLSFTLQNGAIQENGINGCQVDTIIATAYVILSGLNEKIPCQDNLDAIGGLEIALDALRKRKKDREARGVEGTQQD